jgi:hypothetical protein
LVFGCCDVLGFSTVAPARAIGLPTSQLGTGLNSS